MNGHSDIVKFLLQSGALLEMKNKVSTRFQQLSWKILFTVCDDVFEQEGRTALMIASWRGHLETAIELLKAGADSGTQDQVCTGIVVLLTGSCSE